MTIYAHFNLRLHFFLKKAPFLFIFFAALPPPQLQHQPPSKCGSAVGSLVQARPCAQGEPCPQHWAPGPTVYAASAGAWCRLQPAGSVKDARTHSLIGHTESHAVITHPPIFNKRTWLVIILLFLFCFACPWKKGLVFLLMRFFNGRPFHTAVITSHSQMVHY